jgi:hypothetical protein
LDFSVVVGNEDAVGSLFHCRIQTGPLYLAASPTRRLSQFILAYLIDQLWELFDTSWGACG